MNCIDFFSEHAESLEKCKLLVEISHDELIAWEEHKASEYSPGPVCNEEYLYRQINQPIHFDRTTNSFTPEAFNDVFDKGLSVNRVNYISYEENKEKALTRVIQHNTSNPGKDPRSYIGCIQFHCHDFRAIVKSFDDGVEPVRVFAIYDTAYSNDQSHADICLIVKADKLQRRSIRVEIMDLANRYLRNNPL
jgi:hypothetical protein